MTLGWDPATGVAGYKIYYGTASKTYNGVIDAGPALSTTVSNLSGGTTYWFAATSYNLVGLESDYSAEVSYTVPAVNLPPTLNPIANVSIPQDAPLQTVALSGITSGSSSEVQTLVVSAFSSNPSLIANPTVNYTTPQSTGTLTFAAAPAAYGTNLVTVMVDDGGAVSNTTIRTFTVTVVPTNAPPTLDPIADVTLNQNTTQTVNLTGITPGAPGETQVLAVTATSDNQTLLPNPAVSYTSPASTAALTLKPATNAFGTANVNVIVSDGQPLNSTVNRSFKVTVNQVVPSSSLMTNAIVSPNSTFRMPLYAPITNGHKFSFALDASAPQGTQVRNVKGIPYFIFATTSSQASTTNLITIRATDNSSPPVTTNELAQVIILDYLFVGAGNSSVQAGQTASLPLSVACSDGLTNVSFLINWPQTRFAAPALVTTTTNLTSGSVQVQGTNLLVKLGGPAARPFTGSNLVAQLTFQTLTNQSSAFVDMPLIGVTALKPNGSAYVSSAAQRGEVAVVSDVPLLKSTMVGASRRDLLLYGRLNTSYQLQSCTNLNAVPPVWSPVLTYTHTNVMQTFTVDPNPSLIFYRLNQR